MLDRRRFMGLGTAAAAGSCVFPALAARTEGDDGGGPRVRRYVTLGRTGLEVSDVSFGSASSSDPDLVRYAYDRGVTLFDTAESYRGGDAEEAIGEGLKGIRDKVVLTSKTKAWAGETRREMMEALEASLKRLRTDHIDIYFNHAVNDVERMQNPEWWAFTEQAKEQGKIRFRGMSGHGSRLVECLDYAIAEDLVDVILVAYNFGQDPNFYAALRDVISFPAHQPELPRPLAAAKEKNVGVLAMKTLMGARRNDMKPHERDGGTFAQAALRWVLSGGDVHAALISMTSRENIDEYLGGSGGLAMLPGDLGLLARYAYLQHARYCRHGCDGCVDACPEGVEIAEVLRTRMYAVDYENPVLAREDYARLGGGASACLTCAHQACMNACTYGLPIADLTRDAAVRLG